MRSLFYSLAAASAFLIIGCGGGSSNKSLELQLPITIENIKGSWQVTALASGGMTVPYESDPWFYKITNKSFAVIHGTGEKSFEAEKSFDLKGNEVAPHNTKDSTLAGFKILSLTQNKMIVEPSGESEPKDLKMHLTRVADIELKTKTSTTTFISKADFTVYNQSLERSHQFIHDQIDPTSPNQVVHTKVYCMYTKWGREKIDTLATTAIDEIFENGKPVSKNTQVLTANSPLTFDFKKDSEELLLKDLLVSATYWTSDDKQNRQLGVFGTSKEHSLCEGKAKRTKDQLEVNATCIENKKIPKDRQTTMTYKFSCLLTK